MMATVKLSTHLLSDPFLKRLHRSSRPQIIYNFSHFWGVILRLYIYKEYFRGMDRTVSGDGASFRTGPEYVRAGFGTGLDIGVWEGGKFSELSSKNIIK
jgi:hypothetical protein